MEDEEVKEKRIPARSCVAMADGSDIILDVTTEDGQLYTFKLLHPRVTLESLQNALARLR